MNSKIKILIGVLIVGIVLIGGWLIQSNYVNQNNQISRQKTTCTQDTALDFFYSGQSSDPCNRLCNFDNDCKLECGCECISKNEKCIYTGVECEMPNPNYGCKCINNTCKYEYIGIEQVTITTDKTEYEPGEMIRITFSNNKPEPIYVYFEGCRHFKEPIGSVIESVQHFWNMSKFEDGKWRKIITNFELYDDIFCYTDSAGWDTTIKEFKSPVVVMWNQTTYTDYLRKVSEMVTSGKFKVEFCYFYEKDVSITEKEVYNKELDRNITVKSFQATPEKKQCIEKEFTIK